MPRLEYSQGEFNWQVECDVEGIANYDKFQDLLNAVAILHDKINLSTFTVTRVDASYYTYNFVTQDGRSWTQTFQFNGQGIKQTFNVPAPGFFEEEFVLHRAVRDLVIFCIRSYKVSKIEIVY